jgi:prepilin signal peptidase PulO-like enzyme (type II secretory pathway)
MPIHWYVLIGICGIGSGVLLRRLVDWMGAKRGLTGGESEKGTSLRSWLYFSVLTVSLTGVWVGLLASGGEPVVRIRRGVLALLLMGGADADARWGVIPDDLIVCGLGTGILFLVATPNRWDVGGAALGIAGLLFSIRKVSAWVLGRPGFGLGDVKLVAVLGFFLGWGGLWALYLAALIAGIAGGVGMVLGSLDRTSRLPFAPFLVLGTVVQWFVAPFDVVTRWLYL